MSVSSIQGLCPQAAVGPLFEKHAGILSAPIAHDNFLSQVARGSASHQFLANSAQSVSSRQVAFLAAVLQDYFAAPASEIKVLDWGCGKGQITYLLQNRGFDVTSCDIKSEKADSTFGQEVPIIEAKQISVVPLHHPSALPFQNQTFDCVVSFGVLEHVHSDIASLHEIRRILKPGGIFFVTLLPYVFSWGQAVARLRGITYHDRLYNRRQLRQLAKIAHFEVAATLHAQLFPKNSVPIRFDGTFEPIDRFLCRYTPLKYLATNLEAALIAV